MNRTIPISEHPLIVIRYENGEKLQSIADSFHVGGSTIYRLLRKQGVKLYPRIKRPLKTPKYDLTGKRFGHIEVISMAQTIRSQGRTWRAICRCHNCGRQNLDMCVYDLRKGHINSCGCVRNQNRKTGKNSINFTGYEEISGQRWSQLLCGAKSRNINFQVSIQDIWNLFIKQQRRCALTGQTIEFAKTSTERYTASLDRIDSSKDYTLDNIQWVHRDVNLMKRDMDQKTFLNTCRMVNDYALANER